MIDLELDESVKNHIEMIRFFQKEIQEACGIPAVFITATQPHRESSAEARFAVWCSRYQRRSSKQEVLIVDHVNILK